MVNSDIMYGRKLIEKLYIYSTISEKVEITVIARLSKLFNV